MNIALVSMPWAHFDAPSGAIGSLSAWLRRERPQHAVSCHHPYIEQWLRCGGLYEALCGDPRTELLFLPLIFPGSEAPVRAAFSAILATKRQQGTVVPDDEDALFEGLLAAGRQVVTATATRLAPSADLVGFTVTYSQLFSSLAVAQALKALRPTLPVVLGGAGVDGHCGSSLLQAFPWVDYVVQGEGERPLTALVDALHEGQPLKPIAGVCTRGLPLAPFDRQARLAQEIAQVDKLPIPDFDDFAALADEHSIFWHLPVEASRGCWWNRALQTGNPKRACYFCNINIGSYRQKSAERVGDEVRALTRRYKHVRLRFVDSAMRRQGLEEMLEAMTRDGADLRFNAEVRASIRPHDLLRLWQAGCHHVQIGIEGLSSAYLRRMGKGATTIQNLQAMKTCYELGLHSASNLLTHFPGTPQQEVDEMVRNVQDFASAYEPTDLSHFALMPGSTVAQCGEDFGVSNIRNDARFAACLPPEVARVISLFRLDYDAPAEADWTPLECAVSAWRQLHASVPADRTFSRYPLYYSDGGEFLEIVDRRDGFRTILLEDHWRQVYLACMSIQRVDSLLATLGPAHGEAAILEVLDALHYERLLFREGSRCLSLAPAITPLAAARRIVAQSAGA